MHLHYLHLSNLLIKPPSTPVRTEQDILDEIHQRAPLQSLLNLVQAWDEQATTLDFILISGDIAHSGQAEEYRVADVFCQQLRQAAQLPAQRLFVVPGNHDIDRHQVKTLHRKRLYRFADQADLTELLGDAPTLALITQKFTAFNQFASQVMARSVPYGWGIPLTLDKQGWRFTINLVGLNTALFGGYDGDDQQQLAVSQHQLARLQQNLDKEALFTLACLHHPASTWHAADQITWAQLQDKMHVILTGPTHNPEPDTVQAKTAHVFSAQHALCRLTRVNLTDGACETQAYRYQAASQDWRLGEQAADIWSIPTIQPRYADYQQHRPALYVIRIALQAFQCFTELSLDLIDACDDIRLWLLCLGDNSAGKSALLRSVGLGLARHTSVLQPHIHTPLLQRGAHKGQICIDLMAQDAQVGYRICTDITPSGGREQFQRTYYRLSDDPLTDETSAQPIREDDFPWSQLFVCGYGTGRSLEENAAKHVMFNDYSIAEAVTPLFNYQRPMQHPELSLRRIISIPTEHTDQLARFQTLIADLFMLAPTESIELTVHGLEVVRANRRTALTAEGDGYRNTAGWVLDLLTWKMLQSHSLDPKTLTGIVLIDEIEQHLHPRWQRHILRLLQHQFPKLQFIATSHSALCAGSLVDLPDSAQAQLLTFSAGTDTPTVIPVDALQGLKADQILTSEAFGLATTRNPHMADKLARYAELFLQHPDLSPSEQQEYDTLQQTIEAQLPEPAEQASTRLQQKALKDRLAQLNAANPRGNTP